MERFQNVVTENLKQLRRTWFADPVCILILILIQLDEPLSTVYNMTSFGRENIFSSMTYYAIVSVTSLPVHLQNGLIAIFKIYIIFFKNQQENSR